MLRMRSPTNDPVRVALTSGHVIVIGPEPREVEPRFVREALAEGAIPEGVDPTLLSPPAQKVEPPASDLDRDEQIRVVLRAMLADRDAKPGSDEFTAGGLPSVPAVNKRLGWRAAREDVYRLWQDVDPSADGDD
jgi:hypothetical protein